MAAPRGVPWEFLVLAAVYFAAAKLGLMLAFVHASATAVWPPTGIALASMLLLGPRVWPAILLGAFLANVTTAGNLWTSLGIATGNTLEGVLGAWLVTLDVGQGDAILLRTPAGRWVLFDSGPTWRGGDAGRSTVLPYILRRGGRLEAFVLSHPHADHVGGAAILWGRRAPDLQRRDLFGLALLLLALVLTGAIVFGDLFAPWVRSEPLEFLCIPALMWAAFRYRQRGAATSLAVLAGIAVLGTLRGAGPFVREAQNESLLLLQAFLVTLALTILPLAAVVRERARAEEELARLAAIVESSDDAIIGTTLDGTITSWNRGAERLYGYAAQEVIGWPIALITPRELDHELPMILDRLSRDGAGEAGRATDRRVHHGVSDPGPVRQDHGRRLDRSGHRAPQGGGDCAARAGRAPLRRGAHRRGGSRDQQPPGGRDGAGAAPGPPGR